MPQPIVRMLLTLGLLIAGPVCAVAGERHAALTPAPAPAAHLGAIGGTAPPVGYVRFCAENPAACKTSADLVFEVTLDRQLLDELENTNRSLNDAIAPLTDLEHFGETERWTFPVDGKGDCEDYVLAKRRALIAQGWPASVLLITVVRDRDGDGQAVLTVVTDRGDLVLDNQAADILTWQETGYRFVKRQSQGDPNLWVSLGNTRSPPVVGGGR